ncbi:MAG: hypothetical protein HeimC3_40690 [Candidatus Heimdallarchaeota archaeon LC_3]|nr:MAG: hypothetical protein HeimC3_40690 [Candidatus Heimdallarchaeota archaeon LC_3]
MAFSNIFFNILYPFKLKSSLTSRFHLNPLPSNRTNILIVLILLMLNFFVSSTPINPIAKGEVNSLERNQDSNFPNWNLTTKYSIINNSDGLFLNIFTNLHFIEAIYLENVVVPLLAHRIANSTYDIVWGYYTPQLIFNNLTLIGTIEDNNLLIPITFGVENASITPMFPKTDNYTLITIFHAIKTQFSFSFDVHVNKDIKIGFEYYEKTYSGYLESNILVVGILNTIIPLSVVTVAFFSFGALIAIFLRRIGKK